MKKTKTQRPPPKAAFKTISFKVPPEFHREFKTWASSHGVSMLYMLAEGFRLLKETQK
jgi:hypothetical protein